MRSFRIYSELLNSFEIQSLSGEDFKRLFLARIAGESNIFDPFIKPFTGRLGESEWAELRAAVFARDNFTCRYCGERGGRLECDHVVPVSRGGSNELANLATACFACNRSKRDKLVGEWRP